MKGGMKLVVGLGNPGPAYTYTRHNVGFTVADALCKDFGAQFRNDRKSNALKVKLHYQEKDFVLCKPLSYMNLSGGAVLKLMREHRLAPEDILVVCDDANVGLGRIKIKAAGSAGGHHGLESIIHALASERFSRLRIGVSAPVGQKDISAYVLAPFSKDEQGPIHEAIEKAKEAVLCWLKNGVEITMNRFNRMRGEEK